MAAYGKVPPLFLFGRCGYVERRLTEGGKNFFARLPERLEVVFFYRINQSLL
jgi:hypothetical protein